MSEKEEEEFIDAAKNGDLDTIKRLLEINHVDVNCQNSYGITALLMASITGHHDVVDFLAGNGAYINAMDNRGSTALIYASQNGHFKVVERLAKRGAYINMTEKRPPEKTALMKASENGHLDVVEFLVDKGGYVNKMDKIGETALESASQNGHLNVVEFLAGKGADINKKDKPGRTALMSASRNGHVNVVKFLVDKGADVNVQDKYGSTALMEASSQGHFNVAEFLIEKGGDVNAKDGHGATALWQASWECHLNVVKLLVEKGAYINIQDKDGQTVLMSASEKGHLNVVEYMVEHGADINVKDNYGKTAFEWADNEEIEKCVERTKRNQDTEAKNEGVTWHVKQRIKENRYTMVLEVGKGQFAKVFLHKDLSSGHRIAVKKMKKKIDESFGHQRELDAISRLESLHDHENVIAFYHHEVKDSRLHIFMEYCEGNLSSFIQQNELNIQTKFDVLKQVARGMAFIHENRIIHKDLKPDNILIKKIKAKNVTVKVADFGLAYTLDEDENTTTLSLSFGGSRPYMAPEMLQAALSKDSNIPRTYKVDVWSFGVVTYKVIKGEHPFKHIKDTLQFDAKLKIIEDFKDTPIFCVVLLMSIFNQDPEKRPTMKNICSKLSSITINHRPSLTTMTKARSESSLLSMK